MAEVAETGMAMDDLNLLANDNVSKDGKEGEDGRKGRFPVDHKEWNMVDFEAIGEVTNAGPAGVCMGDDNDLMAAIDKFLDPSQLE